MGHNSHLKNQVAVVFLGPMLSSTPRSSEKLQFSSRCAQVHPHYFFISISFRLSSFLHLCVFSNFRGGEPKVCWSRGNVGDDRIRKYDSIFDSIRHPRLPVNPNFQYKCKRRASACVPPKSVRLPAAPRGFSESQRGLVATLKGRDCCTAPPSRGSAPPRGIPG